MRCLRTSAFILAAAGMLLGAARANATPTEPGSSVQAIWRVYQFDFHFRAAKGHYHSCESLQTKISGILEAMGADSVVVNVSCSSALTENAFVRVATVMPVEATPENVEPATMFSSEQQLIAKLRGSELPTPADLESFPATQRSVEIKQARGIRLGPEDCDLLRDMNEQVILHLPYVRVVKERLNCRHSLTGTMRPVLVVEALMKQEA